MIVAAVVRLAVLLVPVVLALVAGVQMLLFFRSSHDDRRSRPRYVEEPEER